MITGFWHHQNNKEIVNEDGQFILMTVQQGSGGVVY